MTTPDYPDWSDHATVGTLDIGNVTGAVSVQNVEGGVVVTGDTMVYLGSLGPMPGPTTTFAKVFTLVHALSAILVVGELNNTWPTPACVAVTPTGLATGVVAPATVVPVGPYGGASQTRKFQCVVPIASTATGGIIVYTYIFPALPATRTVTLWYFGLTAAPAVSLRSDGRGYPIGGLLASGTATAVGRVFVAAPASPGRLLLLSVSMNNQSGLGRVAPSGGGPPVGTLVRVNGAVSATVTYGPAGLLLGVGSGLTVFNSFGTTASMGSAIYDVVI